MTSKLDGRILPPDHLGPLIPERILFEHEGPRSFLTKDPRGELLFAHQCGESVSSWRYAVVPFSEELAASLEAGTLDLLSALQQPWLWLVDCDLQGHPLQCVHSNIGAIPKQCLPRPGFMLYPDRDPLLNIHYLGKAVRWGSSGIAFLADAMSRVAKALDDLLPRVMPNVEKPSGFPVLLQGGSLRVLVLPPPPSKRAKLDYSQVSEILSNAMGRRTLNAAPSEAEVLGLKAALALAPPEDDRVDQTEVSGLLVNAGERPILLSRDNRRQLRGLVQEGEARLSRRPAATRHKAVIAAARQFWIEAGGMNGTYRNWLEIPKLLRTFFSADDWKGGILVQMPDGVKHRCPTRDRERHYGQWVPMYRIQLPQMTEDFYRYQVIGLSPVADTDVVLYELAVVSPTSEIARYWKERASHAGILSRTGGPHGRSFGYW